MAKQTLVNQLPATGAVAMFNVKATLKLALWLVKSSGDATTLFAATDGITTGAAGAGGMANTNAWFRIQDPGTLREYTIQRGATNIAWRIKYSALAKFTGGAASATQTPSATDEQILLGGGTDAAPTFATLYPADNTYRQHIVAMTTAEGNVYSFWSWTSVSGTGVSGGLLMCEAMGTTTSSASDQDPCVMAANNSIFNTTNWSRGLELVKGWFKFNLGGASFQPMHVHPFVDTNGNKVPPDAYFGSNPYDGSDNFFPVLYGRNSSVGTFTGPKGLGKFIKLKVVNRSYPDTVNLATDAYVYVGDFLFPWPETVVPLV